jgi:hypothetical protein
MKHQVKFSGLTRRESAKLRVVFRKVLDPSRDNVPLSLSALGIADSDFNESFFLGWLSWDREGWSLENVLQVLTGFGFLPQIPPHRLTDKIVFAELYGCDDWPEVCNFLAYCAGLSIYRQLPDRWQTRAALLHVSLIGGTKVSTLEFAAQKGTLPSMPLHTLQAGDLTHSVVRSACTHKDLHLVEHLLLNSDITVDVLQECFLVGYFPARIQAWIRRCMKPEELLLSNNSLLKFAVINLYLHHLPPRLFFRCYHKVLTVVGRIQKECQDSVGVPDHFAEAITEADKWLRKIAHLKLLKRASDLQRKLLPHHAGRTQTLTPNGID